MTATDIERGLIARYATRVLSRSELPLRTVRHLVSWLNDRIDYMGLPIPKPIAKAVGNLYSSNFSVPEFEKAWLAHRATFLADLGKIGADAQLPEPVTGNIERLTGAFRLGPAATSMSLLIAYYTRHDQVQFFTDAVAETINPVTRVLAMMTGETVREMEELISPTSELAATGLLQIQDGRDVAGAVGRLNIPPRVNGCLDRTYPDFESLRAALLGKSLTSGIAADDFSHIASDRNLITAVIKGALAGHERGVNILLYGPPGTGKTELTKVVASEAGATLHSAGEDVAHGGEADRAARLADLVLTLRLLTGSDQTVLLFDEMEDIAWQLMKRGGSKVYLNRILENNPVPIFWTSNNIHEIDPALLRRMILAVEMRLPPPSQRKRIIARLAERHGVALAEREIDSLARRVNATPAVLENAIRAAKLAGSHADAVERAALGIVRAVSGTAARRQKSFPDFVPELVCASHDLLELTEQLVGRAKLDFSLCLSGPPGTGKSAYARFLARKLGLEVVQKRASDLLGSFVGESERNIANAFEEAREANSFLVFDEADSFLLDRGSAVRSWEITGVNEMLTWMEEHPLPVCFTTNLMDRLDKASLRRFTFHVRYDYLSKEALRRAYRFFFKLDAVPAYGLDFANLTPGDFTQAKKQAEVLGHMGDPRRIVDLLTDISRNKPDSPGNIGFVR